MKASELRDGDVQGLRDQIAELRREQFNLRMQGRTGQTFKSDRLKKNRRDVARILTIINEKLRAGGNEP